MDLKSWRSEEGSKDLCALCASVVRSLKLPAGRTRARPDSHSAVPPLRRFELTCRTYPGAPGIALGGFAPSRRLEAGRARERPVSYLAIFRRA